MHNFTWKSVDCLNVKIYTETAAVFSSNKNQTAEPGGSDLPVISEMEVARSEVHGCAQVYKEPEARAMWDPVSKQL